MRSTNFNTKIVKKKKLGELLMYNQDFVDQGINKMERKPIPSRADLSEDGQSHSKASFYEFSKSQGISLKNVRDPLNEYLSNPVYKSYQSRNNISGYRSNMHNNSGMRKISTLLNKRENIISQ